MIVSEPALVPRIVKPGWKSLARGYRLSVYDDDGLFLRDIGFHSEPTIATFRAIPERGKGLLQKAAYFQKGHVVWQPLSWHFHLPDDVVKSYLERMCAPIEKVDEILDPEGFESIIETGAAGISRSVARHDAAGLDAVLSGIDKRKDLLTPSGSTQLSKILGQRYGKATKGIWDAKGLKVALSRQGLVTIRKSAQEYLRAIDKKIVFKPTATDATQVDLMANSKSFFVKDEYGNRPQWVANQAKGVMTPLFEKGLGREDMARELTKHFKNKLPTKDLNYWTTVADNHISRSRSWGISSSMQTAGIVTGYYQSVLDEATTDICRAINGTEVNLSAARSLAMNAEAVDGGLMTVNPFLRSKTIGDQKVVQVPNKFKGTEAIGFKSLFVAPKTQTGAGTWGVGAWSPMKGIGASNPMAMPNNKVGLPPLHHRCRTTLITSAATTGQMAFPPVPPKPPAGKPPVLMPPPKPPPPPPRKPWQPYPKEFDPTMVPTVVPSTLGPGFRIPTAPGAATVPTDAWRLKAPTARSLGRMSSTQRDAAMDSYISARLAAEKAEWDTFWAANKPKGWSKMKAADRLPLFQNRVTSYMNGMSKAGTGKTAVKMKAGKLSNKPADYHTHGLADASAGDLKKAQRLLKNLNKKVSAGLGTGKTVEVNLWECTVPGKAGFWRGKLWGSPNDMAIKSSKLPGKPFKNTLYHEAGHALEEMNPTLEALRRRYIAKRVAGVGKHTSGKVTYYHARGVAKYVFAQYGGHEVGVEWASTAFEWMIKNPYKLLLRDPDQFHWAFMMMRGVI